MSDTQQQNDGAPDQKSSTKPRKPVKAKVLASPIEINPELKGTVGENVVVSYTRMNPPTIGHGKLVNKVNVLAEKLNCKPMIFLSQKHDSNKNPLRFDEKLKYAKLAFGDVIQENTYDDFFGMMRNLSGKYKNIHVVVGEDRYEEMLNKFNKYNGVEFVYENIIVYSAGVRDPDAGGVEGSSATRMREYAINEDYAIFRLGIPDNIQHLSDEIAHAIRIGSGLENNLAQRMFRALRN